MPADLFLALSDPMRLRMVERLRHGELTAGELGRGLPLSQPRASQHIRVLREAGVVRVRSHGRKRIYALAPQRMRELHDWVERYRSLWEAQNDALASTVQLLNES